MKSNRTLPRRDDDDDDLNVWERYVQPIFAEFTGSVLYTFIACLSVTVNNVFGIGIVHGFAIAVLCNAFVKISGGQFNPAVTLASVLSGGTKLVVGLVYLPFQFIGALLGAAFVKAVIYQYDSFDEIHGGANMMRGNRRIDPFNQYLRTSTWDFGIHSIIIIEIIASCAVYLCYLLDNVDDRQPHRAPLYYGMGVSAVVIATYFTAGGGFNPAVSFAAAISSGYWNEHYVYWAGPIVGALIAALLYRVILGDRRKRLLGKVR
ncbi:aquaporin-8-like [Acanthaster planci]|uniref:Aquaporin-8-like n=1 Tax=Acanthaster planci TaxID=133434 RepID=A0A8B7XYQ7_ACAPL|nr:aquaporin-8-like [Acanthaster planci]